MNVKERFLNYVSYDTQSMEECDTVPSTEKQYKLAEVLVKELKELGAEKVRLAEHCYVYATIPATTKKKLPVIGFIAHMDTAAALSGKNVKPQIIKQYDGTDIILNKKQNIILSPKNFESLKEQIGKDLIVTDGTTLLGADDKAGIAEIITLAEYLLTHKEIEHGTIQIAFTPDEEVGRGVDFFDVKGFGADFAYTVDGGALGELEYENFNAASAVIKITGSSIHPGFAKGKMRNALLIGMEFQQMLPVWENPAYTEKYEGFYHLDRMQGMVEEAELFYIIRDHDKKKFEEKKERFYTIVNYINKKYGADVVKVTIKDSYYNMKEKIEPHFHLIENAKLAMEKLNISPIISPIRGGTDGARLSFLGLPCPNLCTGGHNFHGKYEYIPIQDMQKCVELLIEIVKQYSK